NATGIHPFELVDRFGVDAYRYYFIREIQFGQDGSFSLESMNDRYHADLANGLGNLASRVLAMLGSYYDGLVPQVTVTGMEGDLPDLVKDVTGRYDGLMLDVALTPSVAAVWELVGRANQYLVEQAPWRLAKDPASRDELAGVLYAAAEILRILAVLLSPIMPGATDRLWKQLGISEPLAIQRIPQAAEWGGLAPGTRTSKGEPLFPRLDS
ncbi:MAG TPA: class I tRNA ligase family protein, partial [Actinomycetota bacterium]